MNPFTNPRPARKLFLFTLLISTGISTRSPAATVELDPPSLLKDMKSPDDSSRATVIVSFINSGSDRIRDAIAGSSWWKTADRAAKATGMYRALKRHSDETQAPVLHMLKKEELERHGPMRIKQLWATTQIIIRNAPSSVLEELATYPKVSKIQQSRVFHLNSTVLRRTESPFKAKDLHSAPENWGLGDMGAHEVWRRTGCRGKGVVVGIMDTGIHPNHQELQKKLRTTAGFIDTVNNKSTAYDDNGHGTHCAGVVAGNTVGLAPNVTLLMAKVCADDGSCTDADMLEGCQWMICPYDPSVSQTVEEECGTPPDVVSMSLSAQTPMGRPVSAFMADFLKIMKSLNILFVAAAGNDLQGTPACAMQSYPACDASTFLSVGAVGQNNVLAGFSLQSSYLVQSYTGRLNPDICAPGEAISSSFIGESEDYQGAYATLSGTSMATPHVAGALALVLAAAPHLTPEDIRSIVTNGAINPVELVEPTLACDNDYKVPNNDWGYGKINLLSIFEQLGWPNCTA